MHAYKLFFLIRDSEAEDRGEEQDNVLRSESRLFFGRGSEDAFLSPGSDGLEVVSVCKSWEANDVHDESATHRLRDNHASPHV